MILRKVIPFLILWSFLCLSASPRDDTPDRVPVALPTSVLSAPDFDRTVVPITELKYFGPGLEGDFGTGFCLDAKSPCLTDTNDFARIPMARRSCRTCHSLL